MDNIKNKNNNLEPVVNGVTGVDGVEGSNCDCSNSGNSGSNCDIDDNCYECGACGDDGCCPALMCAYKNMVEHGRGKYCKDYYWDLVLAYKVFDKLNETQLKDIGFDTLIDEVNKLKIEHGKRTLSV